jgi:hypothetical protein
MWLRLLQIKQFEYQQQQQQQQQQQSTMQNFGSEGAFTPRSQLLFIFLVFLP